MTIQRNLEMLSDLSAEQLRRLLRSAGSSLRNSRVKQIDPSQHDEIRAVVAEYGLDGLIAIGGDDTLGQARALHRERVLNCIGVPKTIDNDVDGTDRTFGFETAVADVVEQLERMRVDAYTMERVAVVEIMGRKAGWIALYAGSVAGADITLIREFPVPEQALMARIKEVFDRQGHVVIAVAEGYEHEGVNTADTSRTDATGNVKEGGMAAYLGKRIRECTKLNTQEQVVGYDARNGKPTAMEANFCHELGAAAGVLAHHRKYGRMVALRGGKITSVPLEEAGGGRFVPSELYDRVNMRKRIIPPGFEEHVQQF